jgi:dienelactone hydrolase
MMLCPVVISLLAAAGALLLPGKPTAVIPRLLCPVAISASATQQEPKGQIIDKVVCANNAAQSYALYLPSGYTPTRKWPILYALDPGARGTLPVERFKEAAEKYGWIVVGSNNSRNGPLQPSADAWASLWQDTHNRLAIDQGRVYTTGFSGGARMAILFAQLCGDCVAGAIACGAGFPSGIGPSAAMRFSFFGTVGVDDFNFPELKTLEDALLKANIAHRVQVFPGRHDWPPPPVATEAVEWMELEAMKAGKRQRDEDLINELWQKHLARGEAAEAVNELYEAYQVFGGLIENFKGLHDTSDVVKRINQLAQSHIVKEALREERQQIRRQREIESQINALIAASESSDEAFDDGRRLLAIIGDLRTSAKADADTGQRRIARRVLAGLFTRLFEQGRTLLETPKPSHAALKKFELAVQVAPDRPGGFFYLAWAYAVNGEKKKSLQALQEAIEKGFSDRDAIIANKAFDSLRNEPQYQRIIQSLQGGTPGEQERQVKQ